MSPTELLARAGESGFAVRVSKRGPFLLPVVEGAILPPALLENLQEHRAAILAWLVCRECGRRTSDSRDLERLRDCNPFCDRPGCPYRECL
jgi:hypothetical protein